MDQLSETGSFFMTLLTLSHGKLVCFCTVVEKHYSAQHDLDYHSTKTKDASAKSDRQRNFLMPRAVRVLWS